MSNNAFNQQKLRNPTCNPESSYIYQAQSHFQSVFGVLCQCSAPGNLLYSGFLAFRTSQPQTTRASPRKLHLYDIDEIKRMVYFAMIPYQNRGSLNWYYITTGIQP